MENYTSLVTSVRPQLVRRPVPMEVCSTTWRRFGVSAPASRDTLAPALWIFPSPSSFAPCSTPI
ncbi:hypothetical protein FQN60_001076 [Etheostoma spectabile]|uniref:Uncharacterized protein n=1 Tax=Etheostoma spectabile TaxID=54343 RepID=A0A5J5CA29_9PERO|nr:hypothetical protein FQN60_001076 [Etheostoma spectabile]